MTRELFVVIGGAAIGWALGLLAYRLSPTGRRNRAEIKRLREEIKLQQWQLAEATKRIDHAIEIVKAKSSENTETN